MLIAQLLLADLVEGLAIDTERGGGTCLEPADANLAAGEYGECESCGVEPREGLVDLLDELALAVARAEFERENGILRGAVVVFGYVRGLVRRGGRGGGGGRRRRAGRGGRGGAGGRERRGRHV